MANPLEFYMEMPPVTRVYTTTCVLIALAIQLDFVSPLQLYFNWDLIIGQYQIWRLVTPFCFFGSFGFSFLFNILFTYRYCQMLEEGSFRGRRADFVYMFLVGSTLMIICAILFQILFLGHAFTMMMVYVWSRRNPHIRMNFFAALNFDAPYLPWVLLVFSLILGNNALVDFIGIVCGHLYFFLEDIFPHQPNGIRVLAPPRWLKHLCDESQTEFVSEEERDDGMEWSRDEE